MFTLTRTEDYNSYVIRHFLCDETSDLAKIVTVYDDELYPGWTGLIPSSGKYILKNDLTSWALLSESDSGGGSGGGDEPLDPTVTYIYDGGDVYGW